jgi:hypothetical protein
MNVACILAFVVAAALQVAATPAVAGERTPLVTGMRDGGRIAVGGAHSCVIGSDGIVLCWGENGSGQLGDGTTTDRRTAVPVSNLTQATAIAAGANHTCAIRADGTVHCWGSSSNDQIGPGTANRTTPIQVAGLVDMVAITAGARHTCALGEAMVLSSVGILARRRNDFAQAEELARASLALAERIGNLGAVADATDDLAQVVASLGDFAQAQSLYRRALAMARELGQVHLQCFVLLHLARAQAAADDVAGSAHSLREALRLADEHDFQAGRLMGVLGAAGLRARRGDAQTLAVARRWCRCVLAVAGSNVDIRNAVPALPDCADADADSSAQATVVDALADVREFLDALVE